MYSPFCFRNNFKLYFSYFLLPTFLMIWIRPSPLTLKGARWPKLGKNIYISYLFSGLNSWETLQTTYLLLRLLENVNLWPKRVDISGQLLYIALSEKSRFNVNNEDILILHLLVIENGKCVFVNVWTNGN